MQKKTYLANMLQNDIEYWRRRKIFITAPTGMGKTTFVLGTLLPHSMEKGEKILILCNRKMLRKQYWYDLVKRFDSYSLMSGAVEIKTYQEVAEEIRRQDIPIYLFKEYDFIICDEAHYFYADSDFNGAGTYQLLYGICVAGYKKTMIFMSATMEEVMPLIEEVFERITEYFDIQSNIFYNQFIKYDYSKYADYDRFIVHCVPNFESLAYMIARCDKKTIIFIDNKQKAEKLAIDILKTGYVQKKDIEILTSENIDSQEKKTVVESLALVHRVIPKVLITTSVLDNGVSIHDKDVKNLAIITDSKISFYQMIGRIRAELVDEINLFLVERPVEDFDIREGRCQEIIKCIDLWRQEKVVYDEEKIIFDCVDKKWTKTLELYDKMFVLCKTRWKDLLEADATKRKIGRRVITSKNQSVKFFLNEFALEKVGAEMLNYGKMKVLALDNPRKVIEEQMSWIGKNSEELVVCNDKYKEDTEIQFIKEIMEVNSFTKEEMKDWKTSISARYAKVLFPDIAIKGKQSFNDDKLCQMLERYGFELKREIVDKKMRYTIKRGEKNE